MLAIIIVLDSQAEIAADQIVFESADFHRQLASKLSLMHELSRAFSHCRAYYNCTAKRVISVIIGQRQTLCLDNFNCICFNHSHSIIY